MPGPLHVGVDGRRLAAGERLRQPRGIARYGEQLLGALASQFADDEWRVLVPRGAALGGPARGAPNVDVKAGSDGRATRATAALAGRPRLDRLLGGGVDVIWLPAPAPVALSPGVPYVLTLHDLSFVSRPQDFGRYERLWARAARIRRLAQRATALIAVSEATKADAVEQLGLQPERVRVVRSGAPEQAAPGQADLDDARRRLRLPERYLLFVGALEPRKAPDLLVRAFGEARRRGLDAELVLAGDGPLRRRLGGDGVTLLGRVEERNLPALYAGALATVLPSLLEGFGFTPLESLAAGTAALASDLPALRELLGDGALFVPAGDVAALADALMAIAADEELRAKLVTEGRAATADLSWERAARETRAVLEEAARR